MFESFDGWVREAENNFRGADDYPLVDSSAIDMARELRWIAEHTIREELEGSSYESGQIESLVENFELRLIRSNFALAVRFVILNFLYRLAHFEGLRLKESAPLLHGEVWPHFKRFVDLPILEPGALQEPRAVGWEIANACLSYNWDLAAALFDRLKSLGAITASHCRALKGQMYVCSVVAPRDEGESEETQGHLAWWWRPQLDSAYFPGGDVVRGFRPLGLLGWGMNLADRREYSAEEHARLSDAAQNWEHAFQKDSELLASYWAAWGKCHFVTGDYIKAAREFEHLLALDLGLIGLLGQETEAGIRSQLYQNAAECFQRGGDVERAVRLLEKCVEEFPGTRGLWLKLAGLHTSQPLVTDYEKVRDCLRKEEETDPLFGEDPRVSIAIVLSDIAATDLRATLRRVAESIPANLQFMTSFVSRHWSSFQRLDEGSRKEWVGAAYWLWGGGTPSGQRALLGRRIAGYFAEIAEGQLKRLFDRFRQEKGDVLLQRLPPGLKKDKFQKYLEGSHLSLGDMISEIDGTRRLPVPQYPDLKVWLQRNARRLSDWDSKHAWRLNELRCSSSHPGAEFSDKDAIELYDLSVWLVNRLYGD